MTVPRLLLYCQHSLGIGHLKRSWALAEMLASQFEVTLVSGGAPPRNLDPPRGISLVELPALSQDEAGRMVAFDSAAPLETIRQQRTQRLLAAYRTVRPAVVVIELYPFGRRKFSGELTPLLDCTRQGHRPVVVTSVRDLLVDRGVEQQRHDDVARATLEKYFDAVLVHADPRFSTLAETFRPTTPLEIPVHHTGFVVSAAPSCPSPARSGRILVSGGGGRFAERLYVAALAARRMMGRERRPMTVVAGPLCPESTLARLYAEAQGETEVRIVRTVASLTGEMRASALSVSQCGYNTALDVLRAAVPALVVPFADNGDSEQSDRARRLERLNAVRVLPASELAPETLAAAMTSALRFNPDPVTLNLDGGAVTTRILKTLHDARVAVANASKEPAHASLA